MVYESNNPLDETISLDSVSSEQLLNRYCQSSIVDKFQKRKNSYPKVTLDPRLYNRFKENGTIEVHLIGEETTPLPNATFESFLQRESIFQFPSVPLKSNPVEIKIKFPARRGELRVKRHRFRLCIVLQNENRPVVWCLSHPFRLCGKIGQFINNEVMNERRRRHTKRPRINLLDQEEENESNKKPSTESNDENRPPQFYDYSSSSAPSSPLSPPMDEKSSVNSLLSLIKQEPENPRNNVGKLKLFSSLPELNITKPEVDPRELTRCPTEPLLSIRNILNEDLEPKESQEKEPIFWRTERRIGNRPPSMSCPPYYLGPPSLLANNQPFPMQFHQPLSPPFHPYHSIQSNSNELDRIWESKKEEILSITRNIPEVLKPRLLSLLRDETDILMNQSMAAAKNMNHLPKPIPCEVAPVPPLGQNSTQGKARSPPKPSQHFRNRPDYVASKKLEKDQMKERGVRYLNEIFHAR